MPTAPVSSISRAIAPRNIQTFPVTGTMGKNTDHARGMLTYLNSKHDTIKFELEIPNEDGYLPILDTMIKIEPDGSISRKLYVKAASKGITLNYRSHHPTANKIAIIHSELARARNNSSAGNHREATAMITNKLISNGYPERLLQREREQRASRRHQHRKRRPVDKPQSLVLRVPYINDGFNARIRACLERNKIEARLVNPRPPTILQRSRKLKKSSQQRCSMRNCPIPYLECTTSYVIYEGTCQHCQEENSYIGSTMQQLHHRVQQHIRAAAEHDFSSAFGEHYYRRHRSLKPDILFKIISRTGRDELRLRIQEAYEIQRRSPKLNRRTEELGTGFIA